MRVRCVERARRKGRAGWPDGRRKFGTVSKAIMDVLAAAECEQPVRVIRGQVEVKLGGHVSCFSVSGYFLTRSKGSDPLFERTRHGH